MPKAKVTDNEVRKYIREGISNWQIKMLTGADPDRVNKLRLSMSTTGKPLIAYRCQVKPIAIKAYVGGDHASLCDSCHQRLCCKLYSFNKRVYYCKMPYDRIKRISDEEPKRRQ